MPHMAGVAKKKKKITHTSTLTLHMRSSMNLRLLTLSYYKAVSDQKQSVLETERWQFFLIWSVFKSHIFVYLE